mmetsp:Transcript_159/g.261  ORF Transcript_159/g.261 Transcript_159/m.261 type:complete len:352 (+) Transcript_159:137-1192(+)|eukprot:CAMPEP_0204832918 /NCGR_PEP_ID=MMETSP1346-20131115/15114_1 /ASSEMBLY_ACC=CAM_ASM_000771 /TAXON_ID=215587 /ORGANISM="Aplanochytrium stocchinoi, Strain GSBS06" /LENGTH=351 /DNA_ID=CAMNT_0051965037 /DNA_START=35 /DNA_END=1090 /DNA_ORIENTATION=+
MCGNFDLNDPASVDGSGFNGVGMQATNAESINDVDLLGGGFVTEGVKVDKFEVDFDGVTYCGYIAFKESYAKSGNSYKAPLVLIYPNYAGLKQWDVEVAVFIAKLGYVGLAVDLFASTAAYPFEEHVRNPPRNASTEEKLKHLNGAFGQYNSVLKRPKSWRKLMSLYLSKAREHCVVHPTYAAGIGYCFGGQCVLEMLRNGDDLQGIVSFHGVLQSTPIKEPIDFTTGTKFGHEPLPESERAVNRYNKECRVLICNGELDEEVPQDSIQEFKKEMLDNGIQDWQFHNYGETHHGFALGPKVWSNHYSKVSDRRSTLSMINFFAELWGDFFPPQVHSTPVNANGTFLTPSKL